jgi:hypothetical protein
LLKREPFIDQVKPIAVGIIISERRLDQIPINKNCGAPLKQLQTPGVIFQVVFQVVREDPFLSQVKIQVGIG